MNIRYGVPQADSFTDLLECMPAAEFSKLTRSTIPLLCWWEPDRVRALCAELKVGEPMEAVFEHPVPSSCSDCPQRGKGKASFSDLVLFTNSEVIAIEAKYTEGRYPRVRSWLHGDKGKKRAQEGAERTNREAVLDHWLSCCLGLSPLPDVSELIYQMVHRAASAAFLARRHGKSGKRHVVHLLFQDKHLPEYIEASQHAARVLSSGDLLFHVLVVRAELGHAHLEIEEQMNADEDAAAEALREALGQDRSAVYAFPTSIEHHGPWPA